MTDPLTHLTAALDAAQRDAEAAGEDGTPVWSIGRHHAVRDENDDAVAYDEGRPTPAQAAHIARHDPASVLRRIVADRALIADLLAEDHRACEDSWYNCSAADEYGKRDGNQECDCGRDERVERRVRLLAQGYGWTEETT